jgi:nucleoside phosphorylase
LPVEYAAVWSRLSDPDRSQTLRGTLYEIGKFAGQFLDWRVAVARVGPGNISAGVETERALSHFDPHLILFVGVAGGLKDDLSHGDVVVASQVSYYHSGKAADRFYPRPMTFPTSHSLLQLAGRVAQDPWHEHPIGVQLKPIAAGEVVLGSSTSEVAELIKRYYNDAVAVDMESAGMYTAAHRANRPALAIRGVSDLLDDKSGAADRSRQPIASEHAADFAFALLSDVRPEDLVALPTAEMVAEHGAQATTRFEELLARVPPPVAAQLEQARKHLPEETNVLLRRLAEAELSPSEIASRLVGDPPDWLEHPSSARLWAVVGEFAAAHAVTEPAIDAFVMAAVAGDSSAPQWLARAALSAAGGEQRDRASELIARAQEVAGGSHPYVDVIKAAIEAAETGNAFPALAAAEAYSGDDLQIQMIRGVALAQLGRRTDALAVYDATLEQYPANTVAALEVSRLLLARYLNDESESPLKDLERARELALQARDIRRAWRGDSAEAVVVAADAAGCARDFEGALQITLPEPDGEAMQEEAQNAEVLAQAARAALFTGQTQRALKIAERITDQVEQYLAQGDCFREIPDSDDLAREAYKRALAAATEVRQRVRAYFGLAQLGEWPIEGLEDFSNDLKEQERDVIDIIAATSERARGATEAAIKRLRKLRGSSEALEALVGAYLDDNRVDDAVEDLRAGAERYRNPELRVRAARVLISVGRYEDAEEEARLAMDAVRAGSHQHRELRELRLRLAASLEKWPEVEAQARAIKEESIDSLEVRWLFVRALYHQGRLDTALEEMTREDALVPRSEAEAGLAIELYCRGPHTAENLEGVLDIADRFVASEQVSAAAVVAAAELSEHIELQASVLGRIRILLSGFFERFPQSKTLVRMQAEDAEGLMNKLASYLEETFSSQSQQRERIMRDVSLGRLPYDFVSTLAGRPYATALIQRAAGFLPIASIDTETRSLEREAADQALDAAVVAETSALHVLDLLNRDTDEVLVSFSRVLVPHEVLHDALAAKDALNLPTIATASWDPDANRPVIINIEEELANTWSRMAERLVERVQRQCEVVRLRRMKGEKPPAVGATARPWLTSIEVAKDRKLALFSDDLVVRAAARAEGIPAFGTLSLLEVLVDRGELREQDLASATMELRRNRAVDLPFDEEQILALAAENRWESGPATLAFTRPALWRAGPPTLSLYQKCIAEVVKNAQEFLPDWCSAAAIGCALASVPTAPLDHTVGYVLASTLLMASELADEPKTRLFAPLLNACRQVSASWEGGDPLTAAAEALRDTLLAELGSSTATQMFTRLIDGLQSADRVLALEVFLRPHRSPESS